LARAEGIEKRFMSGMTTPGTKTERISSEGKNSRKGADKDLQAAKHLDCPLDLMFGRQVK
jgi:hypothetical protein